MITLLPKENNPLCWLMSRLFRNVLHFNSLETSSGDLTWGLPQPNSLARSLFFCLLVGLTETLPGRGDSCNAPPSHCLQCVILPGRIHASNPCLAAPDDESLP